MREIQKNEYEGNRMTMEHQCAPDGPNPSGTKGCSRKPTSLIRDQIHGLILYLTAKKKIFRETGIHFGALLFYLVAPHFLFIWALKNHRELK